MLRSEKVATPFTALTVFVPLSVPGSSNPPLCLIAIVTGPVKLVSVLPCSSSTATCTAGWIVNNGAVRLGCVTKARCGTIGVSATALAIQVPGDEKYQAHCGSTEPAEPCTACSASTFITVSSIAVTFMKPVGCCAGPCAFDIVTAYTMAFAATSIGPGPTIVGTEAEPPAEAWFPMAAAETEPTPR